MEKEKIVDQCDRSFFGVVTSMCLDGNTLYVGKGNFIFIYDINNDIKTNCIKVFISNKITKIKIFSISDTIKLLIAIGETQIKYSVITQSQNEIRFKTLKTESGDYAVDSLLVKIGQEDFYLSLGFINNFIEIYKLNINVNNTDISYSYQKTFFSPSKCIVYSMAFYNNAPNIVVASGTVFRDIIIWEVSLNSLSKLDTNIVLAGHEGVIFSVHFINKNQVTSTSDDRTTKLWKINYDNSTFTCDTYFGHSCRVWDSIVNSNKKVLVSIGEDATARVYDIEHNKFIYELNNGHLGKNIRSVGINDKYIWTGGEDGQIIKWSLNLDKDGGNKEKEKNKEENIIIYSLSNNDIQCQKAKQKQKNFTPCVKVLKFIDDNNLLIGTNHGSVLSYSIKSREITKTYFNDDNTRVINSIEVIFDKYLFVGLSDGNIQLINMSKEIVENAQIKIFSNIRIPFISHKYFKESKELFIIISTALGNSKLYYFNDITENNLSFNIIKDNLNNESFNYLEIKTGSRYPIGISSFEITKTKHPKYYLIFMGDYEGRIYFSKLKKISNHFYNFINNIKYLQVHNNDKITKIFFSINQNILYSISRDGKMKKFYITNELNEHFSIKEINSKSITDISSYENILYKSIENFENGEYIIVGHYGRNLLLYNTFKNLIFHTNDVKGVNHPLDAILSSSNNEIIYSNSQTEQVAICAVSIDNKSYSNKGFLCSYNSAIHGRVIHTMNFILLNEDIYLICTGSEDTKINFYLATKNQIFKDKNIKFIGQFTKHECAIRKAKIIKVINKNNNIKEVVYFSIGSKCEAFLFKIIVNIDKCIGDIILLYDFTPKKNIEQFDNTRNMDMCYTNKDNIYSFYITNTLAVTNIYTVELTECDNDIRVISNSNVKNTKSNFIALSLNRLIAENENVILVYGLTNGNLNILNTKDNSDYYFKLHEAGINDIRIINNINSYIIISCGEDCSICISELTIKESKINLEVLTVNKTMHYSAIKSINAFLHNSSIIIISGSYDQTTNISLYDIKSNTFKHIKRIKSCVSEINSIYCLIDKNTKEGIICSAGQGIEFYNMKMNL